jgi:hypothetical protein
MRDEARVLIEQAAVQQAESSASRMRSVASTKASGTAQQDHEASVHTPPGGRGKAAAADVAKAPSVHDRIKRPSARSVLALLKYLFYPLFILDNGMNSISKSLTVLTPA